MDEKIEVDAENDQYNQRKVFSPAYSKDLEYANSTLCR